MVLEEDLEEEEDLEDLDVDWVVVDVPSSSSSSEEEAHLSLTLGCSNCCNRVAMVVLRRSRVAFWGSFKMDWYTVTACWVVLRRFMGDGSSMGSRADRRGQMVKGGRSRISKVFSTQWGDRGPVSRVWNRVNEKMTTNSIFLSSLMTSLNTFLYVLSKQKNTKDVSNPF